MNNSVEFWSAIATCAVTIALGASILTGAFVTAMRVDKERGILSCQSVRISTGMVTAVWLFTISTFYYALNHLSSETNATGGDHAITILTITLVIFAIATIVALFTQGHQLTKNSHIYLHPEPRETSMVRVDGVDSSAGRNGHPTEAVRLGVGHRMRLDVDIADPGKDTVCEVAVTFGPGTSVGKDAGNFGAAGSRG